MREPKDVGKHKLAGVGLGVLPNQGSSTTWLFDMTPHRGRVWAFRTSHQQLCGSPWLRNLVDRRSPQSRTEIGLEPDPGPQTQSGFRKPPNQFVQRSVIDKSISQLAQTQTQATTSEQVSGESSPQSWQRTLPK